MKCVIVDDEAKSREVLKSLLENFCEGIEVAGMAADIVSAVQMIKENRPQLVFLDIHLKEGDSFQILKQFNPIPFEMIFVTAYDEFSVRALSFAGIKCLFKPLDISELQAALQQVKRFKGSSHMAYEMAEGILQSRFENIPVITPSGLSFVPVSQLNYCCSQEDDTLLFFADNLQSRSEKPVVKFRELLPKKDFIWLDEGFLINKQQLQIEQTKQNTLVFKDGCTLTLPASAYGSFQKQISA